MRWTLVAAFGLVACGGDYCERSAKAAEDCGDEISDEDLEACQTALEDCDGNDKGLLNDFLDCIEDAGLTECEDDADQAAPSTSSSTTGLDDFAALLACTAPLNELSPACAESAFGGYSTDTGYYTSSTSSF